jgi:hypothetical protein
MLNFLFGFGQYIEIPLGACTIKLFTAVIIAANGTACFKNVNNCLNTNIYCNVETSGAQSSNLHLNVVHFFNDSVN